LADTELLSLDSSSPSGFVLHSRSMNDLLLALGLLGHSGWVLGQEGELPGCSDAGTEEIVAAAEQVMALVPDKGKKIVDAASE
jgi:hypothetical protein